MPSDASSIGRVVVASWQRAYADLMPKTFLDELEPLSIQTRWEKAPRAIQGFRRVATLQGEVVGVCSGGLARDGERLANTGELYSINVDPSVWGQGVGVALLREAMSAMTVHGFSEAILWVLSGNTRARRFYAKSGWCPTEEERQNSQLIGAPLHELCFKKTLS